MKELCPICSSENVTREEEQGVICIVCNDCGYDEREDLEEAPSFKTNQKAKAKNSAYRTGGPKGKR